MAVGDGQHLHLHRGEPDGESAGVVFDQAADEPLDGAEEGAVDHEGGVALAVRGDVFHVEAEGEVEVELDGRALASSGPWSRAA